MIVWPTTTTLAICTAVCHKASVVGRIHVLTQRHVRSSPSRLSVASRTILERNENDPTTLDTTHRNWQHVLHIAEDAARHAGEIMRRTSGRISVSSTKANARDLVTESDLACQQLIRQTIETVFPDDAFLGEEDVPSGTDASTKALNEALTSDNEGRLLWIVDPIDGTTNFQAGLPMFCASIGVVALSENLEPELVVGVIYNPILDEMVCAVKGQGAYVNGRRLAPPRGNKLPLTTLQDSLVNVGFPVVRESTLIASSRAVAALATRVRGLRMIASASQVLSWIAQNKMQAYVSWDLNAWDVAAGMLIVQESGGSLLNFDGTEATIASRDMIITSSAAGTPLGDEIRQILQENNCLEY